MYDFVSQIEVLLFKAVDINKETFRINIKKQHDTDKDSVLRFWAIPPSVIGADQTFPPPV